MKRTTVIAVFLLSSFAAGAQSKEERTLLERTQLLSRTVFGTKDSLLLEDLFAKRLSYGHSGGKIENRNEAVSAISRNKSAYGDTAVTDMTVEMYDGRTALVRHRFKAREVKADGTSTPLNLGLLLVWVKEKGTWRLLGRQAVKLNQ